MSNLKIFTAFVIGILLATGFSGLMVYGLGDGSAGPDVYIEPGSGVETASYIIYKDGDYTCAKNGTTGRIDERSTNSSAVIQAAIDGVNLTGGLVHIKAGIYSLNSTLYVRGALILHGEGHYIGGGSHQGTVLQTDGAFSAMVINSSRVVTMRDIQFDGDRYNGTVGIQMDVLHRSSFYNVLFWEFSEFGVVLNNCVANNFYSCRFMSCGLSNSTGGVIVGETKFANGINFDSCVFDWCSVGVIFSHGYQNTIFGGLIEGCDYSGIKGLSHTNSSAPGFYAAQEIYIYNTYFELNNIDRRGDSGDYERSISIEGVWCAYWNIVNCYFAETTTDYSIYANDATNHIDIDGGRFYGAGSKIYYGCTHGSLTRLSDSRFDASCLPMPATVIADWHGNYTVVGGP